MIIKVKSGVTRYSGRLPSRFLDRGSPKNIMAGTIDV